MFSEAMKNQDFFHSTFIPGLLLYYIAIFKGDIFPRHGNLANTELIGERNSKSQILDLSGLCSQHSILLICFCSFDLFCPLSKIPSIPLSNICILYCLVPLNSILFKHCVFIFDMFKGGMLLVYHCFTHK